MPSCHKWQSPVEYLSYFAAIKAENTTLIPRENIELAAIKLQEISSSKRHSCAVDDSSLSGPYKQESNGCDLCSSVPAFPLESSPHGLDSSGLDRCAVSTLNTLKKALLAALTAQRQEIKQVICESHKRLIVLLGKFSSIMTMSEPASTNDRKLQPNFARLKQKSMAFNGFSTRSPT
ncbi:hypothetical protein CCR75_008981 [Bremia lactucae]|uniref:Uncharacterized protein n=1 Tax=Bremia lactucae TaxID=4779 RepID=A0A976IHH3_BRELC|nr:hypothetical protein CCR75_008981 [Bremia lactucae]